MKAMDRNKHKLSLCQKRKRKGKSLQIRADLIFYTGVCLYALSCIVVFYIQSNPCVFIEKDIKEFICNKR